MERSQVPAQYGQVAGGASQPQLDFIRGLRDERDLSALTEAQRKFLSNDHNLVESETKLTMPKASEMITLMLQLDKKAKPVLSQANFGEAVENVVAGRYAVEHDGVLKFYSVDRPTQGKWAGYLFLNVWASDEKHPIKNREYKKQVLDLIAADPKAAAERFGMEIGSCAICGRTLTDETSRSIGIGPVCRGRSEWYS